MSDALASLRPLRPQALVDRLVAPGGFTLRRARDRADWQCVRALRYEALVRRGDIAEAPERSHSDTHDTALNAATFLLMGGERPVASTRSSVRSARRRWPLPAQEAFAQEIERALGADATIVEASLMVVDSGSADSKLALIHLFKAHMLHCALEDADWLVTAVRDSQIGFFRRMFNMEILSGAERCPGLATPRVLMGLAYREQAALLEKRIPLLAGTAADEREFAA